jgi:hypothetical protein
MTPSIVAQHRCRAPARHVLPPTATSRTIALTCLHRDRPPLPVDRGLLVTSSTTGREPIARARSAWALFAAPPLSTHRVRERYPR